MAPTQAISCDAAAALAPPAALASPLAFWPELFPSRRPAAAVAQHALLLLRMPPIPGRQVNSYDRTIRILRLRGVAALLLGLPRPSGPGHPAMAVVVGEACSEVVFSCQGSASLPLEVAFLQFSFDGAFSMVDCEQDVLEWRPTPPAATPRGDSTGPASPPEWQETARHKCLEGHRQSISVHLDSICPNVQSGFFIVYCSGRARSGVGRVRKERLELRAVGGGLGLGGQALPFMLPPTLANGAPTEPAAAEPATAAVVSWMHRSGPQEQQRWEVEKVGLPSSGSVSHCDGVISATQAWLRVQLSVRRGRDGALSPAGGVGGGGGGGAGAGDVLLRSSPSASSAHHHPHASDADGALELERLCEGQRRTIRSLRAQLAGALQARDDAVSAARAAAIELEAKRGGAGDTEKPADASPPSRRRRRRDQQVAHAAAQSRELDALRVANRELQRLVREGRHRSERALAAQRRELTQRGGAPPPVAAAMAENGERGLAGAPEGTEHSTEHAAVGDSTGTDAARKGKDRGALGAEEAAVLAKREADEDAIDAAMASAMPERLSSLRELLRGEREEGESLRAEVGALRRERR
jgi:hypothetical protein